MQLTVAGDAYYDEEVGEDDDRRQWHGQIEDQPLAALLVKWIHDGELFPAGLNQTKPSSSTVGVSPGNKKYIVSRSCLIYIYMAKNIDTLGKYDQRRLWKLICIVNPFDLLFKKIFKI